MEPKSIREAREQLDLTQTDLANKLGVVRQTIADWETHPERCTVYQARAVSHALAERYEQQVFALFGGN